jgi:hypothetical protein
MGCPFEGIRSPGAAPSMRKKTTDAVTLGL